MKRCTKVDEHPKALMKLCEKFIEDNEISCPESVYQCDHVIEHGYEFIKKVCEIVGFYKHKD
jgi:predicted nuclease of restriction endonuclease-like RecB superfamily